MTAYEHPEWLALLRSIIEVPEDDTRRLAAADWLREHDQPDHGEFIETQIELTKYRCTKPKYRELYRHDTGDMPVDLVYEGYCGKCHQCNTANELRVRSRDLLTKVALTFLDLSRDFTSLIVGQSIRAGHDEIWCDGGTLRFSRGFLSELEVTSEWFLANAERLVWHSKYTLHRAEDDPSKPGSVPRPCPPTAQPITKVKLTNDPRDIEGWEDEFRPAVRAETGLAVWKCDRFPGIDFDLQTEPHIED
jgi:uncharacterized protein (TIGR02996 family)